jgi:hypothetical protein
MRRTTRVLVTATAVVVAAGIAIPVLAHTSGGGTAPAAAAAAGIADAAGSGQSVAQWNRTLITITGTPHVQPGSVHPTRSFAMLQAAEYNAVVSITHAGRPFHSAVPAADDARPDAAADQAAHDVSWGCTPRCGPGSTTSWLPSWPTYPPGRLPRTESRSAPPPRQRCSRSGARTARR